MNGSLNIVERLDRKSPVIGKFNVWFCQSSCNKELRTGQSISSYIYYVDKKYII